MKKLAVLLLAMVMLFAFSAAAMAATIGNDGYPYAMNTYNDQEDAYELTLAVDAEGSNYEWQIEEDGNWGAFGAPNAASITITPYNGCWYRCVVDGVPSKAVQVVLCSADAFYGYDAYNAGLWYVGNGNMAYAVLINDAYVFFDIVGKYTLGEGDAAVTKYLNTTCYSGWYAGSAIDASVGDPEFYANHNIEKLMISFNERNSSLVNVTAVLGGGHNSFAVGADTMLGDYDNFTYADNASLKALLETEDDEVMLQQVQLVGAASVDDAAATDPAFVFAPVTPTDCFWIGSFEQAECGVGYGYAYNEGHDDYNEYYTFTQLNDKNVVAEICGFDSAMAVSWMNLEDNIVKFSFSVGTVADSGAITPATPPVEDEEEEEEPAPAKPAKRYDINLVTPVNGDVDVKSSATYDSGVIITPAPYYGYKVGEVIVTDEDGEALSVTTRANGTYSFSMPRGAVDVEVVFVPVGEPQVIVLTVGSTKVLVNGETLINDVAPAVVNSRTMLPIRVVAEQLGANVKWDADLKQITITKGYAQIIITIGSSTVLINGQPVALDAPAYVENERTYVPVRVVVEALGADVAWNPYIKQVTITGNN